MAYDPGAIDATLAAAVGDDPALMAELREAFLESAKRALQGLEQADEQGAWREQAWRLRALAGTFGAVRLMAVAATLATGNAGDPVLLRRVRQAVTRL